MDSTRPWSRQVVFALAAIGWAAVGVVSLGRPGDPRPNSGSHVIQPQTPAQTPALAQAAATVPVVTVHHRERVSPGLNLVTAGEAARVLLLDPEGTVLHQWHRALDDLVDGGATEQRTGTWERARLMGGGRLLVVVGGVGLVALDRDGKVLWKAAKGAHDDVDVLPDGRIAVLVREVRRKQDLSRARVIIEDGVAFFGPEGQPLGAVSVVDALLASPFDHWRVEPLGGEILQASVMEWPSRAPFAPGHVLLSLRRPGTLTVLDPATRTIPWSKAGTWGAISDVEVLPDGGLAVVETRVGTPRSRVVERDPETLAIRWTRDLRSSSGGLVQRLENGNTLVTASDDGTTVELDPDGVVVWQLGPSAPASSALTPYETERVPAALWSTP